MKRRTGLGVALGFLASIALAGPTAAFTGLTNGSFETGPYLDNGFGFQELAAPNASIAGWTVDAGSVDWVSTFWPAQDGAMSIDMNGADAGTLSQMFATTIGNTYDVSFQLSGNPDCAPVVKTLNVSATGGAVSTYEYDVTGNDLTTMNWRPESYSFLATSGSTTLSFASTTAGPCGPAIDNVAVAEDVPTKDECKDGGWESMIDNVGNSFKNQGDCVSYYATKGKNLGAVPPVTVAGAAADADAATAKQSKKQDKATTKTAKEQKAAKDKTRGHESKSKGSNSKKGK